MKRLIQILAVSLSIITCLADDTETSPYGKIQDGKLDKTQSMLVIALDSTSEHNTSTKEKLRIKLYNNTDHIIYIIEQHEFVDFTFKVQDAAGTIVAPNQEMEKIKHNRDAWMHISRPLEPGQYTIYSINLSKLYDLQSGQTYTIQVWRDISSKEYGFGTVNKIASNALQFVVPQ